MTAAGTGSETLEERFEILLRAVADAVLVVDGDGRIALANAQAERSFGYARGELHGVAVEQLVPERLRRGHASLRDAYQVDAVPRRMGERIELFGLRRDGSEFPVEISLAPVETPQGLYVSTVVHETSKRKRAEEALRESRERFAGAFEFAAIGMAIVAPDGHWVQVNQALCDILGYPREQLLPMTLQDITHPEDLQADLGQVQAMLAGELQTYQIEKRYFHADGHIVRVLLNVSLVRDGAGEPLQFVSQMQDITERHEAQRQLRNVNAELARSNTELSEYAYAVSHDLSEPLRAIGGFSELLETRYRGRLDEQADRYLHHIVSGVTRMRAIMDSLLDYSKIGEGGPLHQRVRLDELIDEVRDALGAQLQESSTQLTCDPLPEVAGDRVLLSRLLQNLIGNAVKFADRDDPAVHVSAARDDGAWRISIADNGIGVEPRHRERIFRVFQRLEPRKYGGHGIGLAICKKIVEQHGGRIWVDAAPVRGSVFSFLLADRSGQA